MAFITLTQTPSTYNLYLYPRSPDAITGMNIYPTTPVSHYDKVDDPIVQPNDDTDYVYSNAVANVLDLYNLTSYTTETGIINYVKLFSRARTHPCPQAPSGVYQQKITCGTGNSLSANLGPLDTAYRSFSTAWTTRPSDSTAWQWSDIAMLQAGIQATSPLTTMQMYSVFRPNGAGALTQLTPDPTVANYLNVDEIIADESTTQNKNITSSSTLYDTYLIPNHTTETGTILSVTMYVRFMGYRIDGGYVSPVIRYSGTNYYGTEWQSDERLQHYCTKSYTWVTRPWDAGVWTWANIDDIEIGVRARVVDYSCWVTQVYLVVIYNGVLSPEVRTTQLYARVNYTPAPTAVTLLAPSDVSFENSRNIPKYLFPDGTYKTADSGRQAKTMTLRGTETTNAIQKMRWLRWFQQNKDHIVITGMQDTNQDTIWRLTDFDYTYGSDVDTYDWTMNLKAV